MRICLAAALFLLTALPVAGEDFSWKDSGGGLRPDTESRKTVHGVGALLLATSDDDWQAKWNTSPDTDAQFTEAHTVEVGKRLRFLTFIVNPTLSADGTVKVACDLSMQRPDGTYATRKDGLECLAGQVSGSQKTIYLAKLVVGFLREKTDPVGLWTVRVTVRDLGNQAVIPLEATFDLR